MATARLPMRHIREILRLKWTLTRSHRETARSLGISSGAVASLISRATAIGLTWDGLEGLTDDALEARLYVAKVTGRPARQLPDPAWIHTELRRAGVTLELLHLEYLQQHPDGYRYSAFCESYRAWVERQRLSMRQVHRAGEKLLVDNSGKKSTVVDPLTGVVRPVERFVAVLGVELHLRRGHRDAAECGLHPESQPDRGVSRRRPSPDRPRSAETRRARRVPLRPILLRTYEEWAAHYGTAIVPAMPARPAKARDKAKVEVAVQVAQLHRSGRHPHVGGLVDESIRDRVLMVIDIDVVIDIDADPRHSV